MWFPGNQKHSHLTLWAGLSCEVESVEIHGDLKVSSTYCIEICLNLSVLAVSEETSGTVISILRNYLHITTTIIGRSFTIHQKLQSQTESNRTLLLRSCAISGRSHSVLSLSVYVYLLRQITATYRAVGWLERVV